MPRSAVGVFVVSALAVPLTLTAQIQFPGGSSNGNVVMRQVPVGTATISGTVVASDTGEPIRAAQVTLNGQADPPPLGVAGRSPSNIAGPGGIQSGDIGNSGAGPNLSRMTVADASGQFVFDHLPPGEFRLSANRNGFVSTNYGETRSGRPGAAIPLGAGQHAQITLRLTRGGVITGLVVGDTGEPLASAQVMALIYTRFQGVRRLQNRSGVQSDDRGFYRIAGLQPGDYLVAATPNASDLMAADRARTAEDSFEQALASATPAVRASSYAFVTVPQQTGFVVNGPPSGYLPTYFPSAPSPAVATTITLAAGEERSGVDVRALLIRGSDVTGTITNPPGAAPVQVSLANNDPTVGPDTVRTSRSGPDGTFVVRNVPPGEYTVIAQTVPTPQFPPGLGPLPAANASRAEIPRLWGRATVTVDGQSAPSVTVTLQSGRSISGQVVFDMAHPPNLSQMKVMVNLVTASTVPMPSFGPTPQATVGTDGRFTLEGVSAGQYSLRCGTGFAKSSVINGTDTLDVPFVFDGQADVTNAVITVTDRPAEISGSLTDSAGKALSNVTVIVAPADSRFWTPGSRRIRTAQTDGTGYYTVTSLAAGDYWIAVAADLDPGSQFDPDVLKALAPASVAVSLTEGAKQRQNLKVAQ